MRFTYLILLTIIIARLAACSSDDGNPVTPAPTAGTPLMPLSVGNHWVRSQSVLNPAGEIVFSDVDSLAIIAIDTVGGEPWYKASNWYYFIGRTDGLWWSKQPAQGAIQLYKYPVLVGDAYDLLDQYGKTTHYKVLGSDVSVTTPAGNFSCWQFHIECPACDVEDTIWIAPNIGDVRSVAVLADGSRHVRELLRYELW